MSEGTETTALVPITETDILALYRGDGITGLVSRIVTEAKSLVLPAPDTEKGRKAIKSHAYKVAQAKVMLDNAGKTVTDDWKKQSKAVDEQRKTMRDTLDALKEEILQPVTEWDAEQARIAKEKADEEARIAEEARLAEVARVAALEEENRILREK